MTDATLRPATPADLPVLEQFQQGVVSAERPYDATLKDADVRYYDLAALIASPEAEVLIAELDGVPVGCGLARLDPAKPYVRHAQQGYLGLMYVRPDCRGRGVNGLILAALADWCRARGVLELRLDVYPDNAAAVRAYEKAGFAPHMLEMRWVLTP